MTEESQTRLQNSVILEQDGRTKEQVLYEVPLQDWVIFNYSWSKKQEHWADLGNPENEAKGLSRTEEIICKLKIRGKGVEWGFCWRIEDRWALEHTVMLFLVLHITIQKVNICMYTQKNLNLQTSSKGYRGQNILYVQLIKGRLSAVQLIQSQLRTK